MNSETSTEPLVPLSHLALEIEGATVDSLAAKLSDDLVIADSLGRRCVTADVARREIEAEAQRRYEAVERMRKQQVATRKRIADINRRRPVPRGVPLTVPDGLTPAAVMTSRDGKPQYDGGTYRPVPTHLDWMFGNAEGGGTIGPVIAPQPPRRKKKGDSK